MRSFFVSYQCYLAIVIPRDRIIVLAHAILVVIIALLITNRLFCYSIREYEIHSDWLE
jgi:hypothetical protein